MFYWNIARIPTEIMIVETTFLFWWCTTLVIFGWEVTPQCFLLKWKSMSEKFGREVTSPHFHFRAMEGDKYRATCFFQAIKGRSTQAKCKQNARNMQETCKIIQPMITQLWHPSPLLLWDWEWCSICKINEYTYCKSNLRKTDFYNVGKNIRLLVLSPLISTLSIKLNKGNNDARWIQFSDNKYSQRKARSL